MNLDNNGNNPAEVAEKKKNKKIIIVGIVVFLLAAVAGTFTMVKKDLVLGYVEKIFHKEKEEKLASLSFKGIQVNLADQNAIHYLSTSIVIEYPENKKLEEEMTEKSYRLKDSIIKVLRCQSVGDLDTGEDITKLKKQILNEINQELTAGKAASIYFEEFIIQ